LHFRSLFGKKKGIGGWSDFVLGDNSLNYLGNLGSDFDIDYYLVDMVNNNLRRKYFGRKKN